MNTSTIATPAKPTFELAKQTPKCLIWRELGPQKRHAVFYDDLAIFRNSLVFNKASTRIRTGDLLIANQL